MLTSYRQDSLMGKSTRTVFFPLKFRPFSRITLEENHTVADELRGKRYYTRLG